MLDAEEESSRLSPGTQIGSGMAQLRIEGPSIDSPIADLHQRTQYPEPTRLALVSTIQFVAALQKLKEDISTEYKPEAQEPPSDVIGKGSKDSSSIQQEGRGIFWTGAYETIIPRSKPLSPGEILGCTAPFLKGVDALMSVTPIHRYSCSHTIPDIWVMVAFT